MLDIYKTTHPKVTVMKLLIYDSLMEIYSHQSIVLFTAMALHSDHFMN